jgi:outer membrane protein
MVSHFLFGDEMKSFFMHCLILCFFCFSSVSFAGGIAVVDFQRAINEVQEGKSAKTKLDKLYEQKQQQLKQMEQKLQTDYMAYEQQKALLADSVRQQKEQELMMAQQQLQQMAMQAETDMQQNYAAEMEELVTKMKGIAEVLGKEKQLDLILETTESGLVYKADNIEDLTDEVIKRYDAKYAE